VRRLKPETINLSEVSGFGFQVSEKRVSQAEMSGYMDIEDLKAYQKLCRLHIEISDLAVRGKIRDRVANSPLFQQFPCTTRREKTTTVMDVTILRE
jgi:hypothetical protein